MQSPRKKIEARAVVRLTSVDAPGVKRWLPEVRGVSHVEFDELHGTASIWYDASQITFEELTKAIENHRPGAKTEDRSRT